MSNTNLPPNIEGALGDASAKLNELSRGLGKQLDLIRNFNKELEKAAKPLKASTQNFTSLIHPLNELRKSINALNKTVIANAQVGIAGFTGSKLQYFRKMLSGLGPPKGTPPPLPPSPPGSPSGEPEINRTYLDNEFIRVVDANTQSIKSLVTSNIQYFNIGNNLVKTFQDFEKLQIQSLGMGIDYNKFLEQNSEALNSTRVSQAQLREVMISNFAAGIKMNSRELQNLNEEMIATGQDTQALQAVNANLLALTGKNTSTVSLLSRVNKEVSDQYQISNDRLVKTMQALSDNLEQASFFGPQAVESVGRLGQELQGVLGVDMPREINTVLSLIQPSIDNLGKQVLLGIEDLPNQVVNGVPQISDLEPMFRKVLKVTAEAQANNLATANTVAAGQLGVSEQQLRAIQRVAEGVLNGNIFQSELAKKQEEEFNTVKQLREKQLDFFTDYGPGIYKGVQAMTPVLNKMALNLNALALAAGAANAISQFESLIPGLGKGGKGGKGGTKGVGKLLRGLGRGGIGAAAFGAIDLLTDPGSFNIGGTVGGMAGAGIGSLIAPGIGTVIGGYLGSFLGEKLTPLEEIRENTQVVAQTSLDQEQREQQAENERRARMAANREELSQLSFVSSMLRDQARYAPDPQALQEAIDRNTKAVNALNTKLNKIPPSTNSQTNR
jgi:methanogenic corrinoid protein MtbC1